MSLATAEYEVKEFSINLLAKLLRIIILFNVAVLALLHVIFGETRDGGHLAPRISNCIFRCSAAANCVGIP
jgi:hypothetical protein